MSWLFEDDITWCVDECNTIECFRNIKNRQDKVGLYSAASLKNTEYCLLNEDNKETNNE